ncbi:TIR domain-containing protein [Tenacibaculum dicentrarchi]|nr:TIR domain-containing protein [Tenacibaculum dicentrarchi]MCD8425871.1 TIR domain-containing protein [Tenacibaculum dicentrarchi]MCD8442914.1 TIR domain-containing protein [Tenacibaculum dicentrarchi]
MGILNWLFEEDRKKRIFISFAIEDVKYRNFLVEQAKKEKSPFEFIDMSVKKAWKQSEWQKKCRTKIKGCDGVIVMLSKYSYHASGVRWEMKCANEEKIPIIGMHIKKNDKGAIPPELKRKKTIIWTWDNLEKEIKSF